MTVIADQFASDDCRNRVDVLLVSSNLDERHALQQILAHTNWRFHGASTLNEALQVLREHPASVVVCDGKFGGGAWEDLVNVRAGVAPSAPIIVTADHTDEQLWAEALNRGAYDVLLIPYQPDEVYHLISAAWRSQPRACHCAVTCKPRERTTDGLLAHAAGR